eukprot:4897964-Pyramimonas_sp.AAC.1
MGRAGGASGMSPQKPVPLGDSEAVEWRHTHTHIYIYIYIYGAARNPNEADEKSTDAHVSVLVRATQVVPNTNW